MRYALALTAAALFAPAWAKAADPIVTFQTAPVEQLLSDVRAAADLVGGEPATKQFNEWIKKEFGDKGLDGIDLSKPVVGYVLLALKPEDIAVVLALPVTGEKEFLAMVERTGGTYKDLGKGLYQFQSKGKDADKKELMRFSGGYAYFAMGDNPEPALAEKAIVPAAKIAGQNEKSLLAVTFHFDRLTPEMKKAALGWALEAKKKLAAEIDDNDPNQAAVKAMFADLEKLAVRYLALLDGADTASIKLGLDKKSGEVFFDATLAPKAGTPLAKEIAARKPAQNRFAGLLTADTVAGFKYTAPLFAPELRSAFGAASENQQRDLQNMLPPGAKGLIDELMKGQARTMKAGEFDFAMGLRGPNKDGHYTVVAAMSFDDPTGVEKELKTFVEGNVPAEIGTFKWDADKAGKVGIHTFTLAVPNLPPQVKLFGDETRLAFAFAPKGTYLAFGPDPIATIKDALAAKPAESAAMDVVVNPARLAAMVEKFGGNALAVERAIGKDDKLMSATSLKVISGKELTLRFAMNLKIIPRAAFESGVIRD